MMSTEPELDIADLYVLHVLHVTMSTLTGPQSWARGRISL